MEAYDPYAVSGHGNGKDSMKQAATPFTKLDNSPAYKRLALQITTLVMTGSLKHGDTLPTEAALCEQFGVNRSTVREGIRLLEETGLVRRSGKRMLISRPTHEEVSDQLERAMVLHDVTFRELWETAMLLEPKTAHLAASHLQQQDLEALERNVLATENAVAEGRSLLELDLEFHNLIAKGVHNRVLLLSREPMSRLFYPTFDVVLSRVDKAGARLLTAHREILNALKSRSGEEAMQWMEKHIKDFRRGYEAAGLDLDASINPGIPVKAPGAGTGE